MERQRKKEAHLLLTREESKRRDRERLENLILAQSKSAKPGHRITMPKELPEVAVDYLLPSTYSKFTSPQEEEDEVPDFMEPPVASPLISPKTFLKLQRKYEAYLKRKAEDLLLEGPVVGSDCEDLLCVSCKTTVEEYGLTPPHARAAPPPLPSQSIASEEPLIDPSQRVLREEN
jgi:hypothetical protein